MDAKKIIEIQVDNVISQSLKDVKYAMLLGEYIGTIKGVMYWDLQDWQKERLESLLKELEEKQGK